MNHTLPLIPVLVRAFSEAWAAAARRRAASTARKTRLRVFLDCDERVEDVIRSEVREVEYVRDDREADVRVIVTHPDADGRMYSVNFIGHGRLAGMRALAHVGAGG
jgi:hypothetical protein